MRLKERPTCQFNLNFRSEFPCFGPFLIFSSELSFNQFWNKITVANCDGSHKITPLTSTYSSVCVCVGGGGSVTRRYGVCAVVMVTIKERVVRLKLIECFISIA